MLVVTSCNQLLTRGLSLFPSFPPVRGGCSLKNLNFPPKLGDMMGDISLFLEAVTEPILPRPPAPRGWDIRSSYHLRKQWTVRTQTPLGGASLQSIGKASRSLGANELPCFQIHALMTREKLRAETERDHAAIALVIMSSSCTRARLWRNDSACNLHRQMHFDSTKN